MHDHYPATSRSTPSAIVSIEVLLETRDHTLIEVGSWVNIIGYVRNMPHSYDVTDSRESRRPKHSAFVEATMIWSAGTVKLEKYDAALTELQKAQKATVLG